MDIKFCENCDNMFYIYSNEDKELYYGCRACSNTIPFENNTAIYNSSVTVDKSEYIKNNKWLINDITLPKITDNTNIQCPNEECDKKNVIKFIK